MLWYWPAVGWEIGRHDPDMAAIFADDDPLVPPDEASAPVVELLAWKRAKSIKPAE